MGSSLRTPRSLLQRLDQARTSEEGLERLIVSIRLQPPELRMAAALEPDHLASAIESGEISLGLVGQGEIVAAAMKYEDGAAHGSECGRHVDLERVHARKR